MTNPDKVKDALRHAAARAGAPVWRRLRPRVEVIAARAADHAAARAVEHAERLADPLRADVAELRDEIAELRAALAETRVRVENLEHHTRLVPEQVAAVEVRLAGLEADHRRRSPAGGSPAGDREQPSAEEVPVARRPQPPVEGAPAGDGSPAGDRARSHADEPPAEHHVPPPVEDAAARSLVREVMAEHARIRARFGALAAYEERIGRLEAELARRSAPGD
ncbi:hypothetical protein [Saccharothrix obliqua]|uniref:hypothetical protein n=1 Tax=Saccharothrix obliqua TaxID=2861747 RepID=UPI001C5CDDD4|nr:hypothetical protein [Saccharothrix obliqua]MBW4716776.1 hypothetical protein [Saccharothrix obliqua]